MSTTVLNSNSIAEDLMRYVETQGVGKQGKDVFAHDWPDFEKTKLSQCIMYIETSLGTPNRLLSGEVSCQKEYLSLFAKARSEKAARSLLFPHIEKLDSLHNVDIGDTTYMSVHAVVPIHYVGTDKNDMYVVEIAFAVLRKPKE